MTVGSGVVERSGAAVGPGSETLSSSRLDEPPQCCRVAVACQHVTYSRTCLVSAVNMTTQRQLSSISDYYTFLTSYVLNGKRYRPKVNIVRLGSRHSHILPREVAVFISVSGGLDQL